MFSGYLQGPPSSQFAAQCLKSFSLRHYPSLVGDAHEWSEVGFLLVSSLGFFSQAQDDGPFGNGGKPCRLGHAEPVVVGGNDEDETHWLPSQGCHRAVEEEGQEVQVQTETRRSQPLNPVDYVDNTTLQFLKPVFKNIAQKGAG